MDNKPIGGFFELETGLRDEPFHPEAKALSNGRACLSVILEEVRPRRVYLPYYCCESVLEPLRDRQVDFAFYALTTALEPATLPQLQRDEMFLYVNYFGLKCEAAAGIVKRYRNQSIIDNTQAFFERSYGVGWSFNSARKFFGVPDGGYLYGPYPLRQEFARNTGIQTQHLIARISGAQEEAYQFFQQSEAAQQTRPYRMSHLTERLLGNVNYELVKERRRDNFALYEADLSSLNQLRLPAGPRAVPFCYPFFPERPLDRRALHRLRIYVACLWEEVRARSLPGFAWERRLASQLLPLPVDHRLTGADVKDVLQRLQSLRAG